VHADPAGDGVAGMLESRRCEQNLLMRQSIADQVPPFAECATPRSPLSICVAPCNTPRNSV